MDNQNNNMTVQENINLNENNNSSVKPKKKFNLFVAVVGIVAVVIIASGVVMTFLSSGSSSVNKDKNNKDKNTNIVYHDNSRNLKEEYTFKEAVEKFAFRVNETTLIFTKNAKVSLDSIFYDVEGANGELANPQFTYEQPIYRSIGVLYLGESSAATMQDFADNLKKGILSDKETYTDVKSVEIIEQTTDYVFGILIDKNLVSYAYYAKQIGDKIYYAYNNSVVGHDAEKINLLKVEFPEFFSCLSVDDKKEPYVYDKIVNVPVAFEKQIKDVNYISSIIVGDVEWSEGMVLFYDYKEENFMEGTLLYDAKGRYDIIDWSKSLSTDVKYAYEDSENFYGIVDDKMIQIVKIYNFDEKTPNNLDELNKFFDAFFISK